jgi:hypothetical protein
LLLVVEVVLPFILAERLVDQVEVVLVYLTEMVFQYQQGNNLLL